MNPPKWAQGEKKLTCSWARQRKEVNSVSLRIQLCRGVLLHPGALPTLTRVTPSLTYSLCSCRTDFKNDTLLPAPPLHFPFLVFNILSFPSQSLSLVLLLVSRGFSIYFVSKQSTFKCMFWLSFQNIWLLAALKPCFRGELLITCQLYFVLSVRHLLLTGNVS